MSRYLTFDLIPSIALASQPGITPPILFFVNLSEHCCLETLDLFNLFIIYRADLMKLFRYSDNLSLLGCAFSSQFLNWIYRFTPVS